MSTKIKDLLHDWAQKILKGVLGFKEDDKYMPVKITPIGVSNVKNTTVEELAKTGIYESNEIPNPKNKIIVLKSIKDLSDMEVE